MMSALANHLWQSTLFACLVFLLSSIFKSNRAAVRYGLWLGASVKFLVPFALLIGLGTGIEWQRSPTVDQPGFHAVQQVSEPLAVLASPARSAPQSSSSPFVSVLLCLWLCGVAFNGFLAWRGWRRMRAAMRTASASPLNLPIQVLCTSAPLEPGVFGIFRPVLMLPEGLSEHLVQPQLDAIVEHELCHVRRRDNLTFALHMIVETLFWFYPPVRWIGMRLIAERERACDEMVLRAGNDPQDYAEAIVTVCRFYLRSPLACASGVTGSHLKRRVEMIMLSRVGEDLSIARKALLVIAGAGALLMPLLVGAINPSASRAQEPAKPVPQLIATSALPEFEVASIKPSPAGSNLKVDFAPGGKLFITNATLRFLIKIAYDIGDDQLAEGPRWIGSKRFDLAAIPDTPVGGDPKNMGPDQILLFHKPTRLRLQRLLADRFQLSLRRESVPIPIFALVVARGGPKQLAISSGATQLNATPANGKLNATGVDMPTLAKFLSEGQTGRPVVNMTGLKDKYDFRLEWSPDTSPTAQPGAAAASQPQPAYAQDLSIFSALQQQLGLKLVPRSSDADRLVVVHAELPSAN